MGTIRESLASIHPSDREMVYNEITKARTGEKHYECQFRRVLPGGKVAWIYSKGEVFDNKRDGTAFMIGINYDISDTVNLHMRLKAPECQIENFKTDTLVDPDT
jgi:PAS domain-containing protein